MHDGEHIDLMNLENRMRSDLQFRSGSHVEGQVFSFGFAATLLYSQVAMFAAAVAVATWPCSEAGGA